MKKVLIFIFVFCFICCFGQKQVQDIEALFPGFAEQGDSIIQLLNIDTTRRYVIFQRSGLSRRFPVDYIVAVENIEKDQYDFYFNIYGKSEEAKLPLPNKLLKKYLDAADSIATPVYETGRYMAGEIADCYRSVYYIKSHNPKTGRSTEWSSHHSIPQLGLNPFDAVHLINFTQHIRK